MKTETVLTALIDFLGTIYWPNCKIVLHEANVLNPKHQKIF